MFKPGSVCFSVRQAFLKSQGECSLTPRYVIGHRSLPRAWKIHTHTTHIEPSLKTFFMGSSPCLLGSFLDLFTLRNTLMTRTKYRKSGLADWTTSQKKSLFLST